VARRLSLPGRAVVAAAIVAVGCAEPSPPSLDGDAVVAALPAAVVPAAPEVVHDVVCPDPVPEVVAQTLVCEARLGDVPITVDVAIDEAGIGAVEVREPLFDLVRTAAAVADRLEVDLGRRPEVVCPGEVVVLVPGTAVDCTATLDGRPLELSVEIVDDDGGFRVSARP
jgi:hypothetical protein